MTEELIRKAFDLTIEGHPQFKIREKMGLDKKEVYDIYRSSLFQQLLLTPTGVKDNKEQNNIDYMKGIEGILFNLLDQYKAAKDKDKPRLNTIIEEYTQIYSTSIYNL